jgi:hypothetical protein
MGGAADLAAALERIKAAVDSRSGEVCIKAMAPVALRYLQQATPVLTGRLRGSERVDSLSASGRHGEAFIAPHTVYARFRNDGGTITPKHMTKPKVVSYTTKRGKRVTYTTKSRLGYLKFNGHYAQKVKQAGDGYIERGTAAGEGPCRDAASAALGRLIEGAGG